VPMSSGDMTCREVSKRLTFFLEGELTARERARVEAHVQACPGCRLRVDEWQAVVDSFPRLKTPPERATSEEKKRLVALFHDHGFHHPRRPSPRVRLGFDGQLAAPGDHIAFFCASEQSFLATVDFVTTGAARGETCVLLGHDEANDRLESAVRRVGVDAAALRRQERLPRVGGMTSADGMLEEIAERVRFAVDRGAPMVRILGNLGWGRPGWPSDRDLLRLEAQVTDAVRRWPVIVLCSYDVSSVTGRHCLLGGLECHPLTCRRNLVHPNELYVPAESFLASLPEDVA